MPKFRITTLNKQYDRSSFSCGNDALDNYLTRQASQDIKRKTAAVFVLTEHDKAEVKAYYTLSATTLLLHDLPESLQKKLPKYPSLPATLIGRLAVDKTLQGEGIGKRLLIDALYRAWDHSREIASMAVIVDAIDGDAILFYKHYHFLSLQGHSHKLFLPMKEIEQLVMP